MVDIYKSPTLQLPTALKNYLVDKNYVVITTEIPVGDIVVYALEWVVSVFATVDDRVSDIFTGFDDRLEDFDITVSDLHDDHEWLKDYVFKLPYIDLDQYYDLKFTHDKEIVAKISEMTGSYLVDITALENKYSVLSGLAVELAQKDDESDTTFNLAVFNIGGRLDDIESEFGGHKNLFQLTFDFFDDPVLWLYEVSDSLIERFF